MGDSAKKLGELVVKAMDEAAASPKQLNEGSTSSAVAEHKRAFLSMFRRWETLFKRKDMTVEQDMWLIAEYYKSLGHLTVEGFDVLTERLKETCTFFPTIKECLDAMRAGPYDWSHPFHRTKVNLLRGAPIPVRLSEPTQQLEYRDDG